MVTTPTDDHNFDHIVVGGGAAGCVLAARLSEDPRSRVALVEAGGRGEDPDMTVPLQAFALQDGPANWQDTTVPQRALDDRRVPIAAGRGLGGGGSINFLAWYRGNHADYDGWAAGGMTGWGWDAVLPHFRRSEDHELGASHWHGVGGPIPVTTAPDINPLSLSFITAGVEQGHALNRDFNGAGQDGFGLLYSNVRDGERISARSGYLAPVLPRENLVVVTDAAVQRVLLDGLAVRGVAVRPGSGAPEYELAAPAVHVCAGGFRSPQLLMLSGIGPAAHLREFGIQVRHDVPGVGANLHDHPTCWVSWPVEIGTGWTVPPTKESIDRYRRSRGGPLASIGQAGAFLRCGRDAERPDIQFTPMQIDLSGRHHPGFSIGVSLVTPRARGTVRLAGPDVHDAPLIDPRLLDDAADVRTLAAGVRAAARLGTAPSMRAVLGPGDLPPDSDEDAIVSMARATTITLNHPVGTCRAGRDDLSVVDPELRVHGIDGLRVVDSSVMPTITRANTHAPSIMIGERGSELIRHSK